MNSEKAYLLNILISYLRRENYTVDADDFTLQLSTHQSFPSLRSVTDTLDYFQITNLAVCVPKTALAELPPFFLAVIKENHGSTISQVSKTRRGLKLLKENGESTTLTIESFTKIWDGTILVIENEKQVSGNPQFSANRVVMGLAMLAISVWVITGNKVDWLTISYVLLSITGCALSAFVLLEKLRIPNKLSTRICHSASLNTSCSEVVNSKSSGILPWLDLSDLSMIYFVGVLIITLSLGINPSFFGILGLLSIPVLVYSIYTQAITLKKWCPLCLGIAATIISMNVFLFFAFDQFTVNISPNYFIAACTILLSPGLGWYYLKPLIKSSGDLQALKTQYLKFRRNKEIFSFFLFRKKQPGIISQRAETRLLFGNPEAEFTITAVTNPTCGFCKDAFFKYDRLLKNYGERFKLNMIMGVDISEKDTGYKVARKLYDLYQENPDQAYEAMSDWYSNRNYEQWNAETRKVPESQAQDALSHHRDWCIANHIPGTPITLLGDYFYPKEYDIADLSLFMEDLIEDGQLFMKPTEKQLR